ncbi:MAG TPA: NAD(P)/FAD-dependent oxidoreductase [Rubrivivax sp.]|jgi:L-2-hydroxyglutarate oxidase LhgO|nr:NAD(P)/FAD-dependent oxidoreductase [Rubrivivax sp.]
MDEVDCIVIGAGVVGLAVARQLARRGREVLVLEAESRIGSATSSRSSEVIHAGLYSPPGSLKAGLCVRGRRLLLEFCDSHGVAHHLCGKLVVAASATQVAALEGLQAQGRANGAEGLELWSAAQACRLEPSLACAAALWSPGTGIVDSHALMLALQGDLERAGGTVVLASPVKGGECSARGVELAVGGTDPCRLRARVVVNCAGLCAQQVALSLRGMDGSLVPPLHMAKGQYFSLVGRAPFTHLIYPMPEEGGLGVHLTLDLAGQARFGPDVQWVRELDYGVDPSRSADFAAAIRRYWPGLPEGALQPAYSGIRPKLSGPGAPAADFMVLKEADHGQTGLVHLFGIESPGLTASLALAEVVAAGL